LHFIVILALPLYRRNFVHFTSSHFAVKKRLVVLDWTINNKTVDEAPKH